MFGTILKIFRMIKLTFSLEFSLLLALILLYCAICTSVPNKDTIPTKGMQDNIKLFSDYTVQKQCSLLWLASVIFCLHPQVRWSPVSVSGCSPGDHGGGAAGHGDAAACQEVPQLWAGHGSEEEEGRKQVRGDELQCQILYLPVGPAYPSGRTAHWERFGRRC